VTEIVVGDARVVLGDCRDVLRTLADNSVDSVVTDPPYELGFMGKSWDSTGIAYDVTVWEECLRVLKPGGHILAFGGSRTWHRLAVAVEDAGFEIRDSIAWIYGSGFPKSLDVSKAIDKKAGAEREVLGMGAARCGQLEKTGVCDGHFDNGTLTVTHQLATAPSTAEAQQWSGWGTALKPAFEPVVVGRKPFGKGVTVAENVLAWGVGGLNIDASRIGMSEKDRSVIDNMGGFGNEGWKNTTSPAYNTNNPDNPLIRTQATAHTQGRWPANVILDEVTAGLVDEQSGVLKSGSLSGKSVYSQGSTETTTSFVPGWAGNPRTYVSPANEGGASRFFYVAKASKRDRNEGLEGLEDTGAGEMVDRVEGSAGMDSPRAGAGRTSGAKNFHPTVKPTQLMRYLIKLVTPPGGTVLDPFTGSGSTGKAALLDGYKFVGAELTEEYLPIIEGRLRWALEQDTDVDETLF
jgi:DNA modification methylase